MEESVISNREQSRHTDSRSADLSSGMQQCAQTIVLVVSEDALTLKVLFLSIGNS